MQVRCHPGSPLVSGGRRNVGWLEVTGMVEIGHRRLRGSRGQVVASLAMLEIRSSVFWTSSAALASAEGLEAAQGGFGVLPGVGEAMGLPQDGRGVVSCLRRAVGVALPFVEPNRLTVMVQGEVEFDRRPGMRLPDDCGPLLDRRWHRRVSSVKPLGTGESLPSDIAKLPTLAGRTRAHLESAGTRRRPVDPNSAHGLSDPLPGEVAGFRDTNAELYPG